MTYARWSYINVVGNIDLCIHKCLSVFTFIVFFLTCSIFLLSSLLAFLNNNNNSSNNNNNTTTNTTSVDGTTKRARLMGIGAPSLGTLGDSSPPMSPLALTTSPAVDSDCSSSDNTTSGVGPGGPGSNSQNQSPADRDKAAALAQQQRKKKARTTFTGRQIFELEKQFELKKYLSSSERAEMAKLLNVTETQVG